MKTLSTKFFTYLKNFISRLISLTLRILGKQSQPRGQQTDFNWSYLNPVDQKIMELYINQIEKIKRQHIFYE